MPIVPIRGVGQFGLLPDPNPFDSPISVPTHGRNVRFKNGNIKSYPVFKELQAAPRYAAAPVLVFPRIARDGTRYPNVMLSNGQMAQITNGVLENVSTGVLGSITGQATVDALGESYFVNNQGYVPVFRNPTDTAYTNLPGWDGADRCVSMRAYKDFLIALNVTKGSTRYPNMVKTSNNVQAGTAPLWDTATPGTNATENVLNDNLGELIDGCTLGNSFIIYGVQHVFRMDFIGGAFLFNYDRIFSEGGIMALNCAVEKDMRHFVFGRNDIYVHDGVSKQSLIDRRVRKYIFNRLDYSNRSRCFVHLDEANNEILFCYPTQEGAALASGSVVGCNEAAVYNVTDNTWTFIDLPGVTSMCPAAIPLIKTWDTLGDWDDLSGANWTSFAGNPTEVTLCAVATNIPSVNTLMFLDDRVGGQLPNAITTDFDFPGYVQWDMKDFDEYQINLTAHKLLRSVQPQVISGEAEDSILIQCGASLHPQTDMILEPPRVFFPWTSSKHDTLVHGRYLSIRISIPSGVWVEISGLDLDLMSISRRA